MFRPLTIVFAAFMTATTVAQAQPIEVPTGVRYSDLDLSTEAGAAKLVDRLRQAAYRTCKQPLGTPVHRRCVAETVAKSVAALNTPLVTKQYLAQR